jgi:hypothetical protein
MDATISLYDVPAKPSDFALLLKRLEKFKALYDLEQIAREIEAMPHDEILAAFNKECGPVSAGAVKDAIDTITACVPPDTKDPYRFAMCCCDAIAAREPTQFAVRLLANWMTTRPRAGSKKWDIPELLDRLAEAEAYHAALVRAASIVVARFARLGNTRD